MKRPFFRTGDKVLVHNAKLSLPKEPVRGRVICDNRQSDYGLTVVVLFDGTRQEMIETFTKEGKRLLASDQTYITLGWDDKSEQD